MMTSFRKKPESQPPLSRDEAQAVTEYLGKVAAYLAEGLKTLGLGERLRVEREAIIAPSRGLSIQWIAGTTSIRSPSPQSVVASGVLRVAELAETMVLETMEPEMVVMHQAEFPAPDWMAAVRAALNMACQARIAAALQRAAETLPGPVLAGAQ